jgi:hypothetical protein
MPETTDDRCGVVRMEESSEYLEVFQADARLASHRQVGIGEEAECFLPGTAFVYWRDPEASRLRAVYNLPPTRADDR